MVSLISLVQNTSDPNQTRYSPVPAPHPSTMPKCRMPTIYWSLFQIFVCEAVAAGIASLPCFLLPISTYQPDIVVPLAFGTAVCVALWITGSTSGGHINPMVTLATIVTRRIPPIYIPAYIVGQFTGALVAMGIAWSVSPFRRLENNTFGLTLPGANVSICDAIIIELVTTLNLILVVLASLDEVRNKSWRMETGNNFPLTLLVVITFNMAISAPITGGSMNPIRSIVAAIYQRNFDRQWIYFIGPPVGCILGCFLYEIIICPFASFRRTRKWLTSRDFDHHCKYDSDAGDDP